MGTLGFLPLNKILTPTSTKILWYPPHSLWGGEQVWGEGGHNAGEGPGSLRRRCTPPLPDPPFMSWRWDWLPSSRGVGLSLVGQYTGQTQDHPSQTLTSHPCSRACSSRCSNLQSKGNVQIFVEIVHSI